jgi:O-antigen/teichoic acid export membrane protein
MALVFGGGYREGGDMLAILGIATLWYCVGYVHGYSHFARGTGSEFLKGACVAGVLTLALDALLIPPFGGEGAAIATCIAMIGAAVVWVGRAAIARQPRFYAALGVTSVLGALGVAVSPAAPFVGIACALVAVWILLSVNRHDPAR